MAYSVRSRDGKQAVYYNMSDGEYYIRDVDGEKSTRYKLFLTKGKKVANDILSMTGGKYGGFEVVWEDS